MWHVSSRSGVVLVAQTAIPFLTLPYLVSCLFAKTQQSVRWTDLLPAAVHATWSTVHLLVTIVAVGVYRIDCNCHRTVLNYLMVVLLTADRYIAICRPLHHAAQ